MKAEITEVFSCSDNKAYQWVTFNGSTEIFADRAAAIARGLELSPKNCTFRAQ